MHRPIPVVDVITHKKRTPVHPWVSRVMCLLILIWLWPVAAMAQNDSAESRLERTSDQENVRKQPVAPSSIKPLNIRVHWRLWKRVISDGKPAKNEMETLRNDFSNLGIINSPSYVIGAISWIEQQLEQKKISNEAAVEAMSHVSLLAPDMPHPYLAHASLIVRKNPKKIGEGVGQLIEGVQRTWIWPHTGPALRYNLIVLLLLSVLLGSCIFLLGQLIRYFSIISHDASRLMPTGFSTNQTLLVLMGIIIVPGVLLQSPLVIFLTLLMMLVVVQQPNERIASALIFVVLFSLPQLEQRLTNEITYVTSDSKTLFTAQYLPCDAGCHADIQEMYKAISPKKSDRVVEYTHMYQLFRQGKTKQIVDNKQWTYATLSKWPRSIRGPVLNLYGAALVSRVKTKEGIEALEKAGALMPKSPAPQINLMRAHQMNANKQEGLARLDRANKINLYATMSFLKNKQREINSYLWVEPLPVDMFYLRHTKLKRPAPLPIVSRIWPYFAGNVLPFSLSLYIGVIGLALIILTLPLILKGKLSTPCPRCALAREPKDGEKTGDHAYCTLCYNTFVAGAQLTFQERVNNEETINARNANINLIKRVLSIITPGSGHAVAGYGLAGFLISVSMFFGLLYTLKPGGFWRASQDVLARDWLGVRYVALFMLVLAVLAGLYVAIKNIDNLVPITKRHNQPLPREEEIR